MTWVRHGLQFWMPKLVVNWSRYSVVLMWSLFQGKWRRQSCWWTSRPRDIVASASWRLRTRRPWTACVRSISTPSRIKRFVWPRLTGSQTADVCAAGWVQEGPAEGGGAGRQHRRPPGQESHPEQPGPPARPRHHGPGGGGSRSCPASPAAPPAQSRPRHSPGRPPATAGSLGSDR